MRKILLVCAALFLMVEIVLRVASIKSIEYRLKDKQLHCYDSDYGYVFLCPNKKVTLEKENGLHYTISTNYLGERLVGHPVDSDKNIWIIGDSIAMGYGVDDEPSAPNLVSIKSKMNVRNLGVDALGIEGTRARLSKALSDSPSRPQFVYYIFNQSEFIDYPRELAMKNSTLRRAAFRIQFTLSKYSAVVTALKKILEKRQMATEENAIQAPAPPPSQDDPVFQSMLMLARDCENLGTKLTIILYLDGNPDGKQSSVQPYQEPAAVFARAHGIRVLDLRDEFKRAADQGLYVQGDGHPSSAASGLFAEGILRDLKR